MRQIKSSDAPLFVRAGINRSEIRVLDKKDMDNFKTTVGMSFSGYGFTEGETVTFPDCEVEDMTIAQIPSFPGAESDQRSYLVGVTRTSQSGKTSQSWLNLRRLTERSFVDQAYPDDFRENMATEYASDYERLTYLRGKTIISTGTTELAQYKFGKDRKPLLDEDGNRVLDNPRKVVTVELEES